MVSSPGQQGPPLAQMLPLMVLGVTEMKQIYWGYSGLYWFELGFTCPAEGATHPGAVPDQRHPGGQSIGIVRWAADGTCAHWEHWERTGVYWFVLVFSGRDWEGAGLDWEGFEGGKKKVKREFGVTGLYWKATGKG